MSASLKWHHKLTHGVGKCSVPMWMGGCPSGFCDRPAYGKRPECKTYYNYPAGEYQRFDLKYNGYVPGLACVAHGGPEARHCGDPCIHCGIPHDDVPRGPCKGEPLSALPSTDRASPPDAADRDIETEHFHYDAATRTLTEK